jgi:hypothetical protein
MSIFNVERVPLEVEHLIRKFSQDMGISRDNIAIYSMTETIYGIERAMYEIRVSLASEQLKEYRYPSDWKQAFKERWFPKWLLKKYPVKYDVLIPKALYPDISLKNRPSFFRVDKSTNVLCDGNATPWEKFPF